MRLLCQLLKYGGDIAVGAMTILTSVVQFAMMPLQGFAQGAQPIISYNRGARNAARVKEAFFLLLRVCLTYSGVLWALVMLFPRMFAQIFNNSNQALINYAGTALRIYMAVAVLFGIQIACQMTFTALGNAKAAAIAAIVRKFVLLLPLIYLMPLLFSADKAMAVYLAEPIVDFLAVSFTATLFFFQFRKVLAEMES